MASVTLSGVSKFFGKVAAVEDLSLTIADHEFVAFLGPSGCGKTTTLNMIAGLETPSRGSIHIGDQDVTRLPAMERNIAMVFQSYALYPHMSVAGNLGFALKVRGLPRGEIEAAVLRAAERLALGDLLERYPRQLSGGQRQRVALGRALVRDPKVFLLDEPLSNLDAVLRVQTRAELKRLFNTLGTTAIYVTHDQAEAMTMSDRIAVFSKGRLQQLGTPLEIYRAPVNRFVASFVGSPPMTMLPGVIGQDTIRFAGLNAGTPKRLADGQAGRDVVVGLRAEDVGLGAEGAAGTIEIAEHLGSAVILHVAIGGVSILAQLPESSTLASGSAVHLVINPEKLYLFDQKTGAAILTPGTPDPHEARP